MRPAEDYPISLRFSSRPKDAAAESVSPLNLG